MADTANVQSLVTRASGSVGGVTFGRNQYGPWIRDRNTPLDPGSPRQIAVRSALSECVTAWTTILSQPERATWDRYAVALRQPSPIARQANVGGLGMYVRSNVPRLQAAEVSLPRVDVAPSLFDLGPFTLPSPILLDAANDRLQVFFTEADPWTTDPGSAMLLWASPPQPATVNFYKGPYRYAGCILGTAPTSPFSPAIIDLPFPADSDERVFIRARVTRSDGRISSSFRLPTSGPALTGPVPTIAYYFPSPLFICVVEFDLALNPGSIDDRNWSLRWANLKYDASGAVAFPGYVRFAAANPVFNVGVNGVTFDPPPWDLRAASNGVPAAPFVDYPFT